MSPDTNHILALTRTLTQTAWPEFKGTVELSAHVNCHSLVTETGIMVNTRRTRTAEDYAVAIAHSLAHHELERQGVSSHSKSGAHNQTFIECEKEKFDEAQHQPILGVLTRLQDEIERVEDMKPSHERKAADRVTLKCPKCRHTLTIRRTAADKSAVYCVVHDERMLP